MSLTSPPWVLILVLFKKSCCYCLVCQCQRLVDNVAWPRSHGFIKTGIHISYFSISCLVSLGTEGRGQFDFSFLDVKTMFPFFFLRNILSFSIPILHWDKFFILLPTNYDLQPIKYFHIFLTHSNVLEVILTAEAVAHVIWYAYVI